MYLLHKIRNVQWKRIVFLTLLIVLGAFLLTGCGAIAEFRVNQQMDLGNRYLAEMKYEDAVVAFQCVIDLEDQNVDAWLGLAHAYTGMAEMSAGEEKVNYTRESARAYQAVVEIDGQNTDAWQGLAEESTRLLDLVDETN